MRAAVGDTDWPAVQEILNREPDPDGRATLVRAACEVPDAEEFWTRIVAETPGTLAEVLLAGHLIEVGWAIRSGLRAKYVSRDQFAAFHEYLRRAERILIDVTAREPGNLDAWVLRMMTVRGLGLGQAEARRRYGQAAKSSRTLFSAQVQLLQQLCPKWGGTFEEVHAFARECMEAAPDGAPNAALVVQGHLEHWAELGEGEDARYLADPRVRAEVAEAEARSVRHPAFRRGYRWLWVNDAFALYHCLNGEPGRAAPYFRDNGDLASPLWSQYLGNAADRYVEFRDQALKAG